MTLLVKTMSLSLTMPFWTLLLQRPFLLFIRPIAITTAADFTLIPFLAIVILVHANASV
jgi:hypothetical protein